MLTVFCTHAKEADVAHRVGEAPASSFLLPTAHPWFGTYTVDPALLTSAEYITEPIYSCSHSGFPDDYCCCGVVQLSGTDPSKLDLQKDFSQEKAVCLAKEKVYASPTVNRHPRCMLCYLLQSLGSFS